MSLVATSLVVKPVETSREKSQFLELPWAIYRDDPNWIPPLRQNQKELSGVVPHPFYKENPSQRFLALRDGKPVGRIVALVNKTHNARHKESRGFWGFFECEDNQETATALFDAARAWLKSQGMTAMRGPCNPSMNYECGLLIEGFDTPPFFMMTFNRPYYAALIEGCGQAKTQDMYAFWGSLDMLNGLDDKVRFVFRECQSRFKLTTRKLNWWKLKEEVKMYLQIYNQSLVGTWGFTPMSSEEADHMASSLRFLLAPEMTTIAEADGKPIGAVFGLLDYNPRIKQIDGKLFPFGWMRLLWNKREIKSVRVISTNVIPEYQKWGVGIVLLGKLVPEVRKWGIQFGEFSWVLESNHLSFKTLKRGGAKLTKTYRLYDGEVS